MRPPGDFLVDVADGDDLLDVIVHLLVGEHREHMAVLALGLKPEVHNRCAGKQ